MQQQELKMKCFVFFFCLFLYQGFLEASEEDALSKIATLFCPKDSCNENDFFSAETPHDIKDATVALLTTGLCSGIVIKLKKGAKECRNPLLLTAGHCVAPYEKDALIRAINHKKSFLHIPNSEVLSLQKQCLNEDKTNCLVTPDDLLQDDLKNAFKNGGVDQALIPIYSSYEKRGKITPYEIDIDKVASETELGVCFKDSSQSVLMTSALSPEHVTKMGLDSKVNPENPSTYIKSHVCNNLRWVEPHVFQGDLSPKFRAIGKESFPIN